MIAFSFLLSCIFPSSRTATVFAYLLVFGSGLVGSVLLSQLANAGLWYADLLEFIPSLALYRYVRIRPRAFCCKGMDACADALEHMICAWMGMIPAAAVCCNPSPKALHHACALRVRLSACKSVHLISHTTYCNHPLTHKIVLLHHRRGLYELGEYSALGENRNSHGLLFSNLNDPDNGMKTVWLILGVEWVIFMVVSWYLEQVRGPDNI
jgi:hypothetical protein